MLVILVAGRCPTRETNIFETRSWRQENSGVGKFTRETQLLGYTYLPHQFRQIHRFAAPLHHFTSTKLETVNSNLADQLD